MDMRHAVHRIVGIYPDRRSADSARVQIEGLGLAHADITLLDLACSGHQSEDFQDSQAVLSALLQDGDIGSVAGTAAGNSVAITLATSKLTLVIVGPVLDAWCPTGWGTDAMGDLAGEVTAPLPGGSDLPALIDHSLKAGHVVLVVHTHNDDETARARDVVSRFVEPCV